MAPDCIPEDLVQWFQGQAILAERHGMPRIQPRWRVVEVEWVWGDPSDPRISKGEWREFRTRKAAEAYAEKLAQSGKTVLTQSGFTFWLDPDEMPRFD